MSAAAKTLRVVLVAASVTFAVSLFWSMRSREPEHHGKPLRYWLARLDKKKARDADSEEAAALRVMGKDALPHLLNQLRARYPRWRKWLADQTWFKLRLNMDEPWERASFGLACLGEVALPALEELLQEGGEVVPLTAVTLGRMCPLGAPVLIRGLTNKEADTRFWCATVLGAVGNWREEEGYERRLEITGNLAVPALIAALSDTNASVVAASAKSLCKLGEQPDRFVPLLQRMVTNSDLALDLRSKVSYALTRYRFEAGRKD